MYPPLTQVWVFVIFVLVVDFSWRGTDEQVWLYEISSQTYNGAIFIYMSYIHVCIENQLIVIINRKYQQELLTLSIKVINLKY